MGDDKIVHIEALEGVNETEKPGEILSEVCYHLRHRIEFFADQRNIESAL